MLEATKADSRLRAATDVVGSRMLRPVLLLYAIARHGDNRLRLLHVPLGFGQEALVVFSSWRAAQNFFLSEVLWGEWYTRVCSAGELISLLLGPYEGIEWVLFDPLPEGEHLKGEHLKGEHLKGEHLKGEHLKGEHLKGEHLKGEHLKGEHLSAGTTQARLLSRESFVDYLSDQPTQTLQQPLNLCHFGGV